MLAAVLAILALAATAAEARVGELDPTFGDAGKVGPLLEENGGVSGMAIGPDGSIVVAKGWTLSRLSPAGAPDPGFGDGGQVELAREFDGLSFMPSDLAVDSRGRVLVAGTITDPDQRAGISEILISFEASWAVVLRLTADGKVDASFGEGRGYVRGDYGMHPETSNAPSFPPITDLPSAVGLKLAVDSLDRPVVLVGTPGMYGPCWGHSGVSWYPRAVVRLTADGVADASFGGGDGIAPLDRLAPSPEMVLALDVAGGPIVGGGEGTACPHSGVLFRFSVDGSRLPGFGVDGARAYPRRYLAAIGSTGAIVLRGVVQQAVLQVEPDGSPNQAFGKNGQVALSLPVGGEQTVRPVAVDARGRTLLVSFFRLPTPPENRYQAQRDHRPRRTYLGVGRLLPNGKVDRAFGKRGWIITPIGPHYEVFLEAAALDPQGRLVVLGHVGTWHRGRGFVLARYLVQ